MTSAAISILLLLLMFAANALKRTRRENRSLRQTICNRDDTIEEMIARKAKP